MNDSVASNLPTAADIEAAMPGVRTVVNRSPLQYNARLSERAGARVLVKREDLQPVRSYKLRGAFNLINGLDADARARGVICASAGNHGQGVAWTCHQLQISARVFVPHGTPRQKRDRINAIGGEYVEVIVGGESYDEAAAAAKAAAAESGATMVHAFDDPRTIVGQGTIAPEIVDQLGQAPDVLIVPVGGGGMLSGCLTWFAERHPETRVVGVEPSGAACLATAVRAGGPVTLEHIDTFVDGAAVQRAGQLPTQIATRTHVELIDVPEGQICTEILDMYQNDGVIAEPAGALAPAAVGRQVRFAPDQTVVAIISGGNNDVSRYDEIIERSLIHEGRKHYFMVYFQQEPQALRRFLDDVLGPEDDITHFEYTKRSNRETGPALVGIELGRSEDLAGLLSRIEQTNITIERIDPEGPFYRYLV